MVGERGVGDLQHGEFVRRLVRPDQHSVRHRRRRQRVAAGRGASGRNSATSPGPPLRQRRRSRPALRHPDPDHAGQSGRFGIPDGLRVGLQDLQDPPADAPPDVVRVHTADHGHLPHLGRHAEPQDRRIPPAGPRRAPRCWLAARSTSGAPSSSRTSCSLSASSVGSARSMAARISVTAGASSTRSVRSVPNRIRVAVIGSQGRRCRCAVLFPHPPFNPYVRFSRIRLTDGLLDMVTPPSGRDGAHELMESLVVEPGFGPTSRLSGPQVAAPLLDQQAFQPPCDVPVQLDGICGLRSRCGSSCPIPAGTGSDRLIRSRQLQHRPEPDRSTP